MIKSPWTCKISSWKCLPPLQPETCVLRISAFENYFHVRKLNILGSNRVTITTWQSNDPVEKVDPNDMVSQGPGSCYSRLCVRRKSLIRPVNQQTYTRNNVMKYSLQHHETIVNLDRGKGVIEIPRRQLEYRVMKLFAFLYSLLITHHALAFGHITCIYNLIPFIDYLQRMLPYLSTKNY